MSSFDHFPAWAAMQGFTLYVVGSSAITSAAVAISIARYEQFYPVCLSLASGKINQMIMFNWFVCCILLLSALVKKMALGTLRESEREQLMGQLGGSVFDALLLSTVFSSELTASFFGYLSVLICCRGFHMLIKSRIEYMEVQPNVTLFNYFRISALMWALLIFDVYYVCYAVALSYVRGPSIQILFGFEYLLLFWKMISLHVKMAFNTYERLTDRAWPSKVGYVRLVEFVEDGMKLLTLVAFFCSVQTYYVTPIHLFRRVFIAFRAFQRSLGSVRDYYQLVRNMNTLFEDATPEQLAEDPMCLICRQEDMQDGKRLPCGHIFHANCLHGWLATSNQCPTCRRSVRGEPPREPEQQPPRAEQQPNQPQPQQQPPAARNQLQHPIPRPAARRREYMDPIRVPFVMPTPPQTPEIEEPWQQPPELSFDQMEEQAPTNLNASEEIVDIQRNISLMREQMQCILQVLEVTEHQLAQLQNSTATPMEETKQESPQPLQEIPEEEARIPEENLSPREVLRRRRLQRFS